MSPLRIVITGSRNWADRDAIATVLAKASAHLGLVTIIQGGARGADAIAKEWATTAGMLGPEFPADWKRLGKRAGPLRNEAMLKAGADIVLAFPIGSRATSPGTWNCIETASAMGIQVRIYGKAGP